MTQTTNNTRCKFIFALLVCFFAIGIAPVFSQQILATAGLGWQKSFDNKLYDYDAGHLKAQANVLFVGTSGFTVSTALARYFTFGDEPSVSSGLNFGLGYVYYNVIYLGGILGFGGNGYIMPTLVAGYDFGNFIVEAELQYYHDFMYPDVTYNGFEFYIGAGVNLGAGSTYR